jgi:hypothetical protein
MTKRKRAYFLGQSTGPAAPVVAVPDAGPERDATRTIRTTSFIGELLRRRSIYCGFPMRVLLLLLTVAGLSVSIGCRYEGIWTGAEFSEEGQVIAAAAAEPLCGCMYVTNISRQPVHLRSEMENQLLGTLNLAPGQQTIFQFDWGGVRQEEVFRIETWSAAGQQLRAQDVLRIDDNGWPWHACDLREARTDQETACQDGSLKMETGRARLW